MNKERFEEILLDPKFNSQNVVDVYPFDSNVAFLPELAAFFGENFTQMIGYDQVAPHHDRSLWMHTMGVIDSIPKPGTKPYFLSDSEYKMLKVVGYLHDIGKPAKMTQNIYENVTPISPEHPSFKYQHQKQDGSYYVETHSFKRHAEESRIISATYLNKLGYSEAETARILFLIAHHDDFMRIRDVNSESIEKMAYITNSMFEDANRQGYRIEDRDLQLLIVIGKSDSRGQGNTIYEFDKKSNTFPPTPSDSLQRKLDTYADIESHFCNIQYAYLKIIGKRLQEEYFNLSPEKKQDVNLLKNYRDKIKTIREQMLTVYPQLTNSQPLPSFPSEVDFS